MLSYMYPFLVIMPSKKRSSLGRKTPVAKRFAKMRAEETVAEREARLEDLRTRSSAARALETDDQHEVRLRKQRKRVTVSRAQAHQIHFRKAAFSYDPLINYHQHAAVSIGKMDITCQNCFALKWQLEPPGMCCANGKVVLPP